MRSQLHFSAAEDELILYVHSELCAADRITADAIDRLLLRCSPVLSACQALSLAGRARLHDGYLPTLRALCPLWGAQLVSSQNRALMVLLRTAGPRGQPSCAGMARCSTRRACCRGRSCCAGRRWAARACRSASWQSRRLPGRERLPCPTHQTPGSTAPRRRRLLAPPLAARKSLRKLAGHRRE